MAVGCRIKPHLISLFVWYLFVCIEKQQQRKEGKNTKFIKRNYVACVFWGIFTLHLHPPPHPTPSPTDIPGKIPSTDFDVNRRKAQEFNLDVVLDQVRDHAADRDAWDMADECKYPEQYVRKVVVTIATDNLPVKCSFRQPHFV